MSKQRDPMLLPLRDPNKRAEELRLLKEYELAGKINRVDSRPVKEVIEIGEDEESTFDERSWNQNRKHVGRFGDGNYQRTARRYG